MGGARRRRAAWWAAGAALLAGGCGQQDAECLARVGRRVAVKFEAATGGREGNLAGSLQAIRANWDSVTLDARVSARLRWERALTGADIRVQTEGGVVELRGTVTDLGQRRRAVELAESTVGVERVVDLLVTPGRQP